jgi:hypothetical protein
MLDSVSTEVCAAGLTGLDERLVEPRADGAVLAHFSDLIQRELDLTDPRRRRRDARGSGATASDFQA